MFKHKIKVLLLSMALMTSTNASATGVPVVDIANTLQAALNVASGYIKEAYQSVIKTKSVQAVVEAIRIYKKAEQHYDAVTGNFGYGTMMNLLADRSLREYTPKEWDDTVDAVNGTKRSIWITYSRLQGAANSFENKNVPYLKNAVYVDKRIAKAAAEKYEETYKVNKTYEVIAKTSLNQVQERIDSTQEMVDKIEESDTPNKKDDLRNTLLAENAMLQQESIRLAALAVKRQNDTKVEEMQRRAEDVKIYGKPITYDWL